MELALLGGLAGLGYIAGKDKKQEYRQPVTQNEFNIPERNIYNSGIYQFAENETRKRAAALSQAATSPDQTQVIDYDNRYRLARMRGESDEELQRRIEGRVINPAGPVAIDQNMYPEVGASFMNYSLQDQQFQQKVLRESKAVEEQIRSQTAMQNNRSSIKVEPNMIEQFTRSENTAPMDYDTFGNQLTDYNQAWDESTLMKGITNRFHHETFGPMDPQEDPSKSLLPGANNMTSFGGPALVTPRPDTQGPRTKRTSLLTHNNMVPFFGGSIKQNMAPTANETRLHNMTGNYDYTTREKKEVPNLFTPQAEIGNVYGSTSFNDRREDIMSELQNSVSIYRQNELPIEQERVAPGLNLGAGTVGRGGFHEMTRILPKETNQQKVNPKISYQNRPNAGKTLTQEGTARPKLDKNRPEKFYTNYNGERNFKTTGLEQRPRIAPKVVLKETNRIASQEVRGNVYNPANVSKGMVIGEFTESLRENYQLNRAGSVFSADNIKNQLVGEYTVRDTRKEITEHNKFNGLLTSMVSSIRAALLDEAKTTTKELTEVNTQKDRNVGNPDGAYQGYLRQKEQKAKGTIKSVTEHNTQKERGIANPDGSYKGYTRQKEQVAKTTAKQLTENNKNETGYMSNSVLQNADGYKVRGVEPRFTQRQETSDNSYEFGPGSSETSKPLVYNAAYNADLNAVKEVVAQGQKRMGSSVKLGAGSDHVNIEVHRIEETKENRNNLLKESPNNDVRINRPNDPDSILTPVITKDKNTTDEEYSGTRVYPELLNAFKKSPYAQSLHSYY